MDKFETRATELLARAEQDVQVDFNHMFAERAVKGTLGSGRTMIVASELYHKRMSSALDQVQSELAAAIQHRGREWGQAIAGIQSALDALKERRFEAFVKVRALARANGSANQAFDKILDGVFDQLVRQISEFGEGWTAPQPTGWHVRHPVWFGAISGVSGAIIGAIASRLIG